MSPILPSPDTMLPTLVTPYQTLFFNSLPFKYLPEREGVQAFIPLAKEGYSVSLIRHNFSYGGLRGLWEIGLMFNNNLVYLDKWYDEVKGSLTEEEVLQELYYLNCTL